MQSMQLLLYPTPERCLQRGGIILRALVFVAGLAAGWIGWQSFLDRGRATPASRVEAPSSPAGPFANAPRPNPTIAANQALSAATNGALVIPVRDASGTAREPLVLVPIRSERPERVERSDRLERLDRPPVETLSPATNRLVSVREAKSVSPPAVLRQALVAPAVATPSAPTSTVSSNRLSRGGSLPSGTKSATNRAAALPDRTLEAQVALVRNGISPGSIDGVMGSQTRTALRAFQRREGLLMTGNLDEPTLARLVPEGGAAIYSSYVVTSEDLERLLPLSPTWLGKSEQARLDYESILELVGERTRMHPNLLRRLNPDVNWTNVAAGSSLRVVDAQPPDAAEKAAVMRIRLAERTLQVFGATSNLLAHFPCSIAQRVEKRPVGEELHVAVVAPNPNYTFDPAVFPESAEARELGRKLILQPGPNNPVGSVWIGLDKPGYGIHGTPKPEEVGRTESHGCFRLANWNARYLLDLVAIGTPVEVLP